MVSEFGANNEHSDPPPPPAQQLLPVEDDLDLRYQQLRRRLTQSHISPARLLLDECDFDVMLSHEEAIGGADLGRKGYATFEQVTQRIKDLMDELFLVEEALHNRVFDGSIEKSFVQMRHLVDLMWQYVRTAMQARRMVAGIYVRSGTNV